MIEATMATTMPCSTPTSDHGHGDEGGDDELVGAEAQDLAHAREVDELDADEEHHRGQHRLGHVLDGDGQEQQHDGHDGAGGDLGELAAAAGAVDHLGLGGGSVDDEGAVRAGHGVGRAEPDQVDVLVEVVVVLGRVGPRRGGALGQDEDEDEMPRCPAGRGPGRARRRAGRGVGSPLGRGPSVATPWAARSHFQLMKMAPMTAMSAPGILPVTSLSPRMVPRTPAETATVVQLIWPMFCRVETSLPMVLVKSKRPIVTPVPSGMPSMPPTWPHATWIPTPVRNPMRTVREQEVGQEAETDESGQDQEHAGHQREEAGEGDVLGAARSRRARPTRQPSPRPSRSQRRPPGGERTPRSRRRATGAGWCRAR